MKVWFFFFTHAKKLSDLFWRKRMILWTNEGPLGPELVQRIMSFSQKYHEQFLPWRKSRNELFLKFDFHWREEMLRIMRKIEAFSQLQLLKSWRGPESQRKRKGRTFNSSFPVHNIICLQCSVQLNKCPFRHGTQTSSASRYTPGAMKDLFCRRSPLWGGLGSLRFLRFGSRSLGVVENRRRFAVHCVFCNLDREDV